MEVACFCVCVGFLWGAPIFPPLSSQTCIRLMSSQWPPPNILRKFWIWSPGAALSDQKVLKSSILLSSRLVSVFIFALLVQKTKDLMVAKIKIKRGSTNL